MGRKEPTDGLLTTAAVTSSKDYNDMQKDNL